MPRKIILASAIIILAIGCIGGLKYYEQHQEQNFISSISPALKNTSLRFSNAQKIILATDQDRTYQNAFDEFEKAIAAIDENILATQTITDQKFKNISDASVKYQSLASDILRSEKSGIKAHALYSAKMNAANEANQLLKSTDNNYVMQRANKLALEALEESLEHLNEISKSSEKSKNLLIEIQKLGNELATQLPKDSLIEESIIKPVINKLSKQ